MKKIENLWEKAERTSIYCVLLIYILGELLSLRYPKLDEFMNTKGSSLLISVILLAIFRYIDKNIKHSHKNEITSIKKFTKDLLTILQKSSYKEINIFANSSFKYYHAIAESQIKIDTVKLLIRASVSLHKFNFQHLQRPKILLLLTLNS